MCKYFNCWKSCWKYMKFEINGGIGIIDREYERGIVKSKEVLGR